jgi:arginyl-tRNA synthetase
MYRSYRQALLRRIQEILTQKYQTGLSTLAVEQPPKIEFGEYALPIAFELAKRLKRAPRKIAEEIVAELLITPKDTAPCDGQDTRPLQNFDFTSFEVAGAGYINCKLDRVVASRKIAAGGPLDLPLDYALIEHTSINPNKAAHIGHLRNAILGDTLARMMRRGASTRPDFMPARVQNYIDNTGVQVADIVVGLTHLEGMDRAGVERWMETLRQRGERIDFVCWDLYARVSQWYEADPAQKEARKQIRMDTLHALEQGGNDTAQIAEMVSTAIVRRHLETMERLGIQYDFLPRESEVLHLHFWDAAFALMKEKGVLYKETAGKNAGCWVMRRAGTAGATGGGPDEEAKVIVRSNPHDPTADGTVTYVGKDIAYHLWKFGKLGLLDFEYQEFYTYPDRNQCFISTAHGKKAPQDRPYLPFNKAQAIYNVIDSRQNDPQNNVIEALRGMGFTKEADNYHHFSYEMVALTPRCAMQLGYAVSEEDQGRAYIEVSGRKGFGVKADDLIDKLIEAAKVEVDARHAELDDETRKYIAKKIAVGALRYYMLRYTRNAVIAFDFEDALSFEGETGPYAQYAAVRAANIFRKARENNDPLWQEAQARVESTISRVVQGTFEESRGASGELGIVSIEEAFLEIYSSSRQNVEPYFSGEEGDSIWEVWLAASKSIYVLEQSIRATEPAYLAKYVFQLAQQFNNFYHRHPILTEGDPARKALLLATAAVAYRELTRALGWLGIEVPAVM